MKQSDTTVFTAEEAADYLKVATKTIRELAATGRLPGRKVGKAWRFLKENLDGWLSGDNLEEEKWHFDKSTVTGISTFGTKDDEYDKALELKSVK